MSVKAWTHLHEETFKCFMETPTKKINTHFLWFSNILQTVAWTNPILKKNYHAKDANKNDTF